MNGDYPEYGSDDQGPEQPEKQASPSKGDEKPDSETTLVSSSLFGDLNPGDKGEFEVVASHDGELEIRPVKKDESRQPEMEEAMTSAFGGGEPGGEE